MTSARLALFVALVVSATGCANAMPSFAGGSTTPERRTDLAIGGAARVPTGDLRTEKNTNPATQSYEQAANAGGIVPVAYGRYGLRRGNDLGLLVAGANVRVDYRHEHVLEEASTRPALVYGVAPYVGFVPNANEGDGRGQRIGVHLPFTYSIDFGGIYDVWVGPRLDLEYQWGEFATATGSMAGAHAFAVRGGGVLGLAAGFRRFHAMVELTAAYEQWWGDQAGASLKRGGIVLIPAFGLRLRI